MTEFEPKMLSIRTRLRVVLLVAALMLTGITSGTLEAQTSTPAASPTPAGTVREVLSSGDPAGAPGDVLELVRYTIPPGTKLPVHTHPGMQVAQIVSGTLSYTVLDGTVPVTRAASGMIEPVTAASGQVRIGPGDSFYEAEGVVHFGENAGTEPVVILVASLFEIGEPPAILVGTPVATPAA